MDEIVLLTSANQSRSHKRTRFMNVSVFNICTKDYVFSPEVCRLMSGTDQKIRIEHLGRFRFGAEYFLYSVT